MPFSWIPDAEHDANPRLTWLIALTFDLAMHGLYRREAIIPANLQLEPGSLVVSNHQRDSDVPILASLLSQRSGLRFKRPMPYFTAREDLLKKGFLRDFLEEADWPEPVIALLARIPLGWLFRNGRTFVLRRIREFTFADVLDALCDMGHGGDAPQRWLRAAALARAMPDPAHAPTTVADLAASLPHSMAREYWGLHRLTLDGLRTLAVPFRQTIGSQLRALAALLDDGRIVYIAPEGVDSLTGRMQRIRAGTARLYAMARRPPTVLPMALSYDPLLFGRWRVVMHVGKTLPQLDPADTRQFNSSLRRAILSQCVLTPSHLLSRWLMAGPERFDARDCERWFAHATTQLANAGLIVDPLIKRSDPAQLVATRLRWLQRCQLLRQEKDTWLQCDIPAAQPGWRSPAAIIHYLDAGIDDVASHAPGLREGLQP